MKRQSTDRAFELTIGEAARYLGVSVNTLRRWSDAGVLHCSRTPGNQRRFSRQALDEIAATRRRHGVN